MSFLYPRTVAILRSTPETNTGQRDYGGVTRTKEATIAAGLAARIQADRQGTVPVTKLPADAAGQSIWLILIKKLPLGGIEINDVIVDELGNRYGVISAEWAQFETTCRAQILKT